MNEAVVVSIVARNYLGQALTLMQSLEREENYDRIIVIIDCEDEYNVENSYGAKLFPVTKFDIPDIQVLRYKYNVVEFSTALKPFILHDLLYKYGYDRAFYVDPDIYVYSDFKYVDEELGDNSMVLTPHLVTYRECAVEKKYETQCLKYGVFNLGFVGVRKCEEIENYLHWWGERLREHCYIDNLFFTDQKWMNYAPCFLEKLNVIKNVGYNMAPWNLSERILSQNNGEYFVNDGVQLRFFHFSGYKGQDIYEFLRPYDVKQKDMNPLIHICNEYHKKLKANNYYEMKKNAYRYHFYDNGEVITALHRGEYRALTENGYDIKNPFCCDGGSLYHSMKANGLVDKNTKNSDGRSINTDEERSKAKTFLDRMMQYCFRILGPRKYERLLKYFGNYCAFDKQLFLLRKLPEDKRFS